MRFFKIFPPKLSIVFIFMLMTLLGINKLSNPVQANELTAYEQEAVELLNKDREAQGLRPLKVDMRLVLLGRDHAADMIKRDYISHVSPEGHSPFDRMRKAGIKYRSAGENIAMHYNVAGAQELWMQSPGHRANILNKEFTHTGIGVVEKGDGSLYLVQMFIGI